jgi:hypothetical protein
MSDRNELLKILLSAKKLARRYRELTGKPLGVTGEIAEYEAARILKVKLAVARNPGFDATEGGDGSERKLQIKGRCLLPDSKRGQRIGSINIKKKWDAVLLVILDSDFDAVEIHEASRRAVIRALTAPGSKSRNERGALGINKFKAIGVCRWRRREH